METRLITFDNSQKSRLQIANNENAIIFSQVNELESLENYHRHFSIKMVETGRERYSSDHHTSTVNSGNLLIVNPFQKIYSWQDRGEKASGYCIYLSTALIGEIAFALQHDTCTLLEKGEDSYGLMECKEILHKSGGNILGNTIYKGIQNLQKSEGNLEEIGFAIAEAFVKFTKNMDKSMLHLSCEKKSTQIELFRRVLLAKNRIDDAPEQALSLDELSSWSALSKYHLLRCFKEVTGFSPHQYQLQQKLQKAAHLLSTKSLEIQEIAFLCGFADAAAFCKSFKKMYQTSPKHYSHQLALGCSMYKTL